MSSGRAESRAAIGTIIRAERRAGFPLRMQLVGFMNQGMILEAAGLIAGRIKVPAGRAGLMTGQAPAAGGEIRKLVLPMTTLDANRCVGIPFLRQQSRFRRLPSKQAKQQDGQEQAGAEKSWLRILVHTYIPRFRSSVLPHDTCCKTDAFAADPSADKNNLNATPRKQPRKKLKIYAF